MPFLKIFSLPCFVYFLLFPSYSSAIASLIPDSTNHKYFSNVSAIPFENSSLPYDTLLENIHQYDALSNNDFYFSLGNIGHAHFPLLFNLKHNSGFSYGMNAFDRYLFLSDSIQYGIPASSMTDIYYIMGSKKEQSISVKHWQRIRHSLFGGLQLRMVNSPGAYKRLKSDVKNFTLHTNFLTKNKKYGLVGNYIHNKLIINENGGIQNDTLFESNIESDRQLMEVNLSEASNFIKQNSFFVRQYYSFCKKDIASDSLDLKRSRFLNPGQISHSFSFSYLDMVYKDAIGDTVFYLSTLDKLKKTYDSIHIRLVENSFFWTNKKSDIQALVLDLSAKIQNTILFSGTTEKKFGNQVYSASISSNPSQNFIATGDMSLTNGTYFSGDMDAGFKSALNTGNFKFIAGIRYSFLHTPYYYSFFESNHFNWSNNFNRTRNLHGEFLISAFGFRINLRFASLDNLVYLDKLAQPSQVSGRINYFMSSAEQTVSLKHWVFKAKLVYQNSSDKMVIAVPNYFFNMSVFYRNNLFKNACLLESGIDGYWFSPFYSPAYMPALRSFYQQDDKKTGGFIYPEIFVDLQIKRARLFLKYVNPVFNYNYYHIPHYPLQDSGFRFGLSWMFYN